MFPLHRNKPTILLGDGQHRQREAGSDPASAGCPSTGGQWHQNVSTITGAEVKSLWCSFELKKNQPKKKDLSLISGAKRTFFPRTWIFRCSSFIFPEGKLLYEHHNGKEF